MDTSKIAQSQDVYEKRRDFKPLDLTLYEMMQKLFRSIENDYMTPEQTDLIDKIREKINER